MGALGGHQENPVCSARKPLYRESHTAVLQKGMKVFEMGEIDKALLGRVGGMSLSAD